MVASNTTAETPWQKHSLKGEVSTGFKNAGSNVKNAVNVAKDFGHGLIFGAFQPALYFNGDAPQNNALYKAPRKLFHDNPKQVNTNTPHVFWDAVFGNQHFSKAPVSS